MTPPLPIDFQPYLAAILTSDDYQKWQDCYTPTTVEDRRLVASRSLAGRPPSRLKLRVETVKPEPEAGNPSQQEDEQREKVEQWDVLAGLRHYATDHVVLIGKPGSGKSTSLERLLREEAARAQQDPSARIPVLVKLRRCTDSLEALIRDFLQQHRVALDISQVEDCLRQGRFLLLLDGLNELPEAFRRAAANFRDRYRATTSMIVSTRDLAAGGVLGIQKTLKMLPLTEPQMREFVRGYLGAEGDRLFQQIQGDRLRKFAETPLLLWMLCRVFADSGQVPSNLGLAFREFAQLHDQDLQADVPTDSRDQWPKLLRHLAFEMMQGKTPTELRLSISQEAAEDCLTTYLQEAGWADPRGCAVRWLQDLVKYHLIQPVIQPNFEQHLEFRHQLIQEYYAAESLLRCLPKLSDEELNRDYLNYLKWTEPVALMLSLLEDEAQALRVVRLAMDEVDLMLGARLAGEVKPALQSTTVGWIDQKELPIELKVRCWGASRSEESMPGILSALSNSETNVRERVLEALEAIGGEKAVDGLLLLLNDSNHGTRGRAVAALGRLGNERAINDLLLTLGSSDMYPQIMAKIALKKMGTRKVVDELLLALQESDSDIREQVVEILGEIGGEVALDGLLNTVHDSNPKIRAKSVEYLGRLDGKRFIDILMAMMQDSDPNVRRQVVNTLGALGGELATDFLIIALQDLDPSVRQEAMKNLGKIGNKRAIDALMASINDLDECSYWTLLEVFTPIIGDDIFDILLSNLSSSEPYTRGRAAELLGGISSEEAVDGLLSAVYDSDQHVSRCAITALGRIGNEKAVDGLLLILESYNNNLRREAVSALGEIRSSKAIDGLLLSLNDSDAYIRFLATEYLGGFAGKKELDGLLNALKDVEGDIRSNAAMWLGKANSGKAVDSLLLTLKDPEEFVRSNSAWALVKIGSKKAINDLLAALDDSSIGVRTQAAEGIGNIGDPQLLTILRKYQLTSCTTETCSAIAKIQNRCQFYNYELWQTAESISTQPQLTNMTEKSEYNAKYVIHGNPTIVEKDMTVYGDHVGTKNIYNYFGTDPALSQEIADLQQFVASLEAANPNLKTEQEADQIVTIALDQVQTQEPARWQKIRPQMGIFKKQILNPERHLQAAKATGIEVAKHYAENSLIVKAIITYIDKLSETPDQGA